MFIERANSKRSFLAPASAMSPALVRKMTPFSLRWSEEGFLGSPRAHSINISPLRGEEGWLKNSRPRFFAASEICGAWY
jgi:hypothetical protein